MQNNQCTASITIWGKAFSNLMKGEKRYFSKKLPIMFARCRRSLTKCERHKRQINVCQLCGPVTCVTLTRAPISCLHLQSFKNKTKINSSIHKTSKRLQNESTNVSFSIVRFPPSPPPPFRLNSLNLTKIKFTNF